jgi:hypothetical protein
MSSVKRLTTAAGVFPTKTQRRVEVAGAEHASAIVGVVCERLVTIWRLLLQRHVPPDGSGR